MTRAVLSFAGVVGTVGLLASSWGCGSVYDDEEVRDARAAYVAPPAILVVQCPSEPGPCAEAVQAPVVVATAPAVVAAPPPVDPAIASTIERRRPKFEKCYRKGLRRNPGLQGTVVLHLTVDDEGEVKRAWTDGTLVNSKVVECIVDEAEDLDFKHPVGPSVTYPLAFHP